VSGRGNGLNRFVAGAFALGLLGGCSAVLGIEADREVASTDSGSTKNDASSLPAGWTCIDDPKPTVEAGSVTLTIQFTDAATASSSGSFEGDPIPGLDVRICTALDFSCASPIGNATSAANGNAVLVVPKGFDGFYEVRAPEGSGYPPVLIRRMPQLHDEWTGHAVTKKELLETGASLVGIPVDPAKGIAILSGTDCGHKPRPGLTFSVSNLAPDEKVVYIDSSLPSDTATSTDGTGSALVYNVPPGTLTMTGFVLINGAYRPIKTLGALARTGWLTFVQLRPETALPPTEHPK
jgi:hypothetical protein